MSVQDLQQLLLTYSLLLPRIISCFVVLPVLAKQTLGGGLVRNGVACSLGCSPTRSSPAACRRPSARWTSPC